MTSGYSGRLELTWTNKDRTLLAQEDQSYEWVDPTDYRVSEVRLLHDVTTVGDVAPRSRRASDNLLIRGDALHALNALTSIPEFSREYTGNVKLVYIDPPFNTGQAFEQYDDALEHSVWLTMVRDRLVQIGELLSPDGSVWVHVDDVEAHRCRSVLDEVFGAANFIATVIWQKADSPRNSARYLSVDQDYIHVYAKDAAKWRPYRLARTAEADASYRNPDNDPRGPWTPGDPFANKPYSLGMYEVTGPTGNVFGPPPGRYWRISQEKFEELDRDGRIWWRGGGEARPRIKRYLAEVSDLVPRTVWDYSEVGSSGDSSREIRKLFPDIPVFATPKPEKLIARILEIGTLPGDIVLDCYAGSGTTAAVAHKMRRRWVTSEWSAKTVATFTLPRLTKIVNNEDPGGITTVETPSGDGLPDSVKAGSATSAAKTIETLARAGFLNDIDETVRRNLATTLRGLEKTTRQTRWSGGGGFRVLEVGPSMFEELDGRVYLADWATSGALGEAVAAQFGYEYAVDGPFSGTKGKTRLAVVDGLVNEAVVRLLASVLPEGQKLMLCGTAIDPDCRMVLRELRPGSTMKKIPAAILDDYRTKRRDRLALASVLDWTAAEKLLDGSPAAEPGVADEPEMVAP